MAIKSHEYDRVIEKFGFETKESHHRLAWLIYHGRKVVKTRRSHIKGRDLPAQHAIRKQLHLNSRQLREAVVCTLDRQGYIEILRDKQIIEEEE